MGAIHPRLPTGPSLRALHWTSKPGQKVAAIFKVQICLCQTSGFFSTTALASSLASQPPLHLCIPYLTFAALRSYSCIHQAPFLQSFDHNHSLLVPSLPCAPRLPTRLFCPKANADGKKLFVSSDNRASIVLGDKQHAGQSSLELRLGCSWSECKSRYERC